MGVDCEFQVLVVGGGLGGLSVAGFLADIGLEPVVAERDAVVGGGGTPIELWPAAMSVLERLDVADAVRGCGTTVGTWSIRAGDGTVARRLSVDNASGFVVIRYGRLREIILEALSDDLTRMDTTVRGLTSDAHRVSVTFDTGVTEPFDAVIGADGVGSTTRSRFGGADARTRDTTSYAFRFDPATALEGAVEQWFATGAVLRVLPVGEAVWGWLTVPSSASVDRSSRRGVVTAHLSRTDWSAREWLSENRTPVRRDDLQVDANPLPSSRVALLGDAVHSPHRLTGFGPVLALADAAGLATALSDDQTAIRERLVTYADRRRTRLERLEDHTTDIRPLDAVEPYAAAEIADVAARRHAHLAASVSSSVSTAPADRPSSER